MELLAISMMVLLFAMLFVGVHVGLAMALVGVLGTMAVIPANAAFALLGQTVMDTALNYELSVIPLFVLMGYLTAASGLSRDLYESFNVWLGARRGGLAMATIAACGAFGAISGSSVATAATMSEVALPQMRRYDYSDRLATGVIAAGGTIGILIPPSVIMVIYGVLTQTSIVDLFMAGVIPGILLVGFFLTTVRVIVQFWPQYGPPGNRTSFRQKIEAIRNVFGTIVLFAVVMGGIYLGVFTPLEAAGIGAFGAWVIALAMRRLSWNSFVGALLDSVRTTVMIFTILIGALVFKNFMALAQVPNMIDSALASMHLSGFGTLMVIVVVYLVLGAVLDTMAMIFLTIPVFFPLVSNFGFDPVWFGILVVVLVELALISPPMGMNVFIIKGMSRDVELMAIYRGVIPFVIAQFFLLILLIAFPQIALWLPALAHH